jgi:hypothetical protein
LGCVGAILGSYWGHVGVILGHVGPISGHAEANFGPCWGQVGPCWAILGSSWGHLGAISEPSRGHLGAILGTILEPSSAFRGYFGPSWDQFGIVLGPSWVLLEVTLRGACATRSNVRKHVSFSGPMCEKHVLSKFQWLKIEAGEVDNQSLGRLVGEELAKVTRNISIWRMSHAV